MKEVTMKELIITTKVTGVALAMFITVFIYRSV